MVKISIITASFNREGSILDSIKSCQMQSYKNIENIFIDGCSTDATPQIIRENMPPNSCFICEQDEGIYFALNKGLSISTGDVVGVLHTDDFFVDSDVLSDVALQFEDPNVDAVYGDLEYVAKSNINSVVRKWKASPFNQKKIKNGWMPPHPTLFIRKKWFLELGAYDTNLRISSDYDLILRFLSAEKFYAKYIGRVLVRMRLGGESNASFSKIFRKSYEDYISLRKNGYSVIESIRALVLKNISKISQFV